MRVKKFLEFKSTYQKMLFLISVILFSLIFGLHLNQNTFAADPPKPPQTGKMMVVVVTR